MELSKARELIQKYKDGTLTPVEKAILESWYLDLAKSQSMPMDAQTLESHLDQVWNALPVNKKAKITSAKELSLFWRLAVAASVIFVLGAGAYLFRTGKDAIPIADAVVAADVAPGENQSSTDLG